MHFPYPKHMIMGRVSFGLPYSQKDTFSLYLPYKVITVMIMLCRENLLAFAL